MTESEALTYLNLPVDAEWSEIEDAWMDAVFKVKQHFLAHYPLRILFQKRIDALKPLIAIASLFEFGNVSNSTSIQLPDNEMSFVSQYEWKTSRSKEVIQSSWDIPQITEYAIKLVDNQEWYEQQLLDVMTSLETKNIDVAEVKIGQIGDYMVFRNILSRWLGKENLLIEELEVLQKEKVRIQKRLNLRSAAV